jgi:dihydroorotase
MQKYLIRNVCIVNEGTTKEGNILISNGRIEKVGGSIETTAQAIEIDGKGKHLLPGVIDDQVHFREPGLTHKATIYTEAKAGVAGGVTSFMEMPNTVPPVFTHDLLENKYAIAAAHSLANYSFFMGTSNENLNEALRTNEKKNDVCGIKIFMGSSTGGLLVNAPQALDTLFRDSEVLIATHCEDELVIAENLTRIRAEGRELEAADHMLIRDEEACYSSSRRAVDLAIKYNTRLHILHITTAREAEMFLNLSGQQRKRITAEVCVHHLHFSSEDYARLGNKIKCNPAIKEPRHREALWNALLEDGFDVIATDHAPHTLEEKMKPYEQSHAGLPLLQHSLPLMLQKVQEGRISIEKMVSKMSHAVADCFQIRERGYIREGYHADLVLADLNTYTAITPENILFKCGWSPLEGVSLPTVTHTFVNGRLVFDQGNWDESAMGQRLRFQRD